MADRDLTLRIKARDTTGRAVKSARRGIRSIAEQLERLQKVVAVGGALYLGFRAVQRVLGSVLGALTRQEQAQAQVAARIRATGEAAGYGAGELTRMAAELQQVTAYGDEAILEMQALLLSFRNIRGDTFRDATEAVLDLSVGVGTDLRSAAIQLGKALNDPIAGLDGLSRSGTTFSEAQKETIKRLAETGRVAEAQALVLDELKSQYGGAARAARDTLGGALAALGNAWGDLLEQSSGTRALREELERLTGLLQDPATLEGARALGDALQGAFAAATSQLTGLSIAMGRLLSDSASLEIAQLLRLRALGEGDLERIRLGGAGGAIDYLDDAELDQRLAAALRRLALDGKQLAAALAEGIRASGADVSEALLAAVDEAVTGAARVEALGRLSAMLSREFETARQKFLDDYARVDGETLDAALVSGRSPLGTVQGRVGGDARFRALLRDHEEVNALYEQTSALREKIASAPLEIVVEGGGGGGGAAKASAAASEIARIHAQAQETIAGLTLDRHALIERETAAHIAKLEALKGAQGANEAERLAAIEAAREAGRARQEALIREEIRLEAEQAKQRKAAYLEVAREIESAALDLATPYQRAAAEANRWRTQTLARLAEVAAGHEDYAERVARVNEIVKERLANAQAEYERDVLDSSRRWQDGVTRALRDIAEEAGDSAGFMEDATQRAFSSMEDALVEFATTGKLEFADLANSIIAELARIAIRKSIIEPLAEGLEGVLGDFFRQLGRGTTPGTAPLSVGSGLPPFAAGVGHAGAVAGELGGRRRAVAPELFAHAPRYHRGGIAGQLRPNEVPVIVEKGEGVFTAEQMAALGGRAEPRIEFNLINQGTGKRETGGEVRFDAGRWVVSVMTDDIDNNGPFTQALFTAGGLRRQGV